MHYKKINPSISKNVNQDTRSRLLGVGGSSGGGVRLQK